MEWTIEKYRREARREPERLKFWLLYYDYDEACRAVCDNPPRFDATWKRTFPDPKEFRAQNTNVSAAGEPSGDKPPSLLDNASLPDRRVDPLAKPPSDNTSQLAIAARAVIRAHNDHLLEGMDSAINDLRAALQQQA